MDDDVKTLMAILALIYGSSNGVGLFKSSLEPLKSNTEKLSSALGNAASTKPFRDEAQMDLLKSLFFPSVLIYVMLVLLPVAFLILVVSIGPDCALMEIGLRGDDKTTSNPHGNLFYWILLGLSSVSAFQLLSEYWRGWKVALLSLRKQKI